MGEMGVLGESTSDPLGVLLRFFCPVLFFLIWVPGFVVMAVVVGMETFGMVASEVEGAQRQSGH